MKYVKKVAFLHAFTNNIQICVYEVVFLRF
jgi:hypothetical protein